MLTLQTIVNKHATHFVDRLEVALDKFNDQSVERIIDIRDVYDSVKWSNEFDMYFFIALRELVAEKLIDQEDADDTDSTEYNNVHYLLAEQVNDGINAIVEMRPNR